MLHHGAGHQQVFGTRLVDSIRSKVDWDYCMRGSVDMLDAPRQSCDYTPCYFIAPGSRFMPNTKFSWECWGF